MIAKNQLKRYRSLKRKKFRVKTGQFLAEGLRVCEEIYDSDYHVEEVLYCPTLFSSKRAKRLIQKLRNKGVPATELDEQSLKLLSDTVHSQGIVAITKTKNFEFDTVLSREPSFLVALDQVSDPGNLGTIIRSACWFGANAILLSQNSVEYTNPKVVRSSMGSLFHLPIVYQMNLKRCLKELQTAGYSLFVADSNGETAYDQANFCNKNVLTIGNEVTGVCDEIKKMADQSLKIPKKGRGDSLNASVAAGILMSVMAKKIRT